MTEAPHLHMALSDVAALAQVQRPVVSMWRKRSAGTANPFPAPVTAEAGREMFDADQIAAWLAATGRGNNPEAANDAAAFARPATAHDNHSRDGRGTVDGLTALLALKVMTGSNVGGLSAAEILDTADEYDPDDHFLYSELEALGPKLGAAADFADRLVDSAYNAPSAFEQLLGDRFRAGLREHAETALAGTATDLVSAAAIELAASLGNDAVFVDPTSGGSDLLLGIVRAAGDNGHLRFLTPDDDGAASRLVRRRLRVHGVEDGLLRKQANGEFTVHGPAVHVAQYPPPGETGMNPERMLSAIEHIAMQMDDQQRAVIVAPAAVLCDAPLNQTAAGLRAGLLRAGRVRAIVRLPAGLLRAKPREAQALWVLGPSFADVDIADKWTMVADLTLGTLSEDVVQDLISDIVASMGDLPTVRAHSFRFARFVRTRVLLAGRGSLVAASTAPSATPAAAPAATAAEASLRIEELSRFLSAPTASASVVTDAVSPAAPAINVPPASVRELLAAGALSYRKGNRLEDRDLRAAAGTRVIGPADLLHPHTAEPRHINLMEFAAKYPSGRLTQPGDVVFCTSPRPAAIIDVEGGSAVVFPARVLRIDAGDPGGLLADVLAADINALPDDDKTWRQWRLRRTPDAQRHPLAGALTELQHVQHQTRERLKCLEELATLILDGVAGGSLTLTEQAPSGDSTARSITHAAAPNEGTL